MGPETPLRIAGPTDLTTVTGLIGGFRGEPKETDADAYMRVVAARYELLRTHQWSGEILDRLQGIERRRRAQRRHRPRWGGKKKR